MRCSMLLLLTTVHKQKVTLMQILIFHTPPRDWSVKPPQLIRGRLRSMLLVPRI